LFLSLLSFTNKYIALNHEWNITGNYAVIMHKTLKNECVYYKFISFHYKLHSQNKVDSTMNKNRDLSNLLVQSQMCE